jgi:hypothetical protein
VGAVGVVPLTDDGKVIKVEDGKVVEVTDAEAEVEPVEEENLASVETDGGALSYEDELEVGTEVFVTDEEGNQTPAPDGDYKTEDGKTIKVADGKVAEIVEEAAEESTEETKDETAEQMETLSKENAELKAQVAELQKQVQELKNKPLVKSAHEELETSVKMQRTGDKGLDRLAARFAKK